MNEREGYDDLSSLFLPDILNPAIRVKQEDYLDATSDHRRNSDDVGDVSTGNSGADAPGANGHGSSFGGSAPNAKNAQNNITGSNVSLGNFNFGQSPQQMDSLHMPYANFLPFEGALIPHGHGHHHVPYHSYQNGQQSQFDQPQQSSFQNSQQQMQQLSHMHANNAQLGSSSSAQMQQPFLSSSMGNTHQNLYYQHQQMLYPPNHPSQQMPLHYSNSSVNFLNQVQGFSRSPNNELSWTPNQLDALQTRTNSPFPLVDGADSSGPASAAGAATTVSAPTDDTSPPSTNDIQHSAFEGQDSNQKEKKRKIRRTRELADTEVDIDYRPSKLKRLLDFKKAPATNNYKIVEQDGNEITVDFNGFLNGRFLTNDIDNTNYMFTKNELTKNQAKSESPSIKGNKTDPKVISCYRRNYIQISLNVNISGFKTANKLLKLTSDEYGYSMTRVIKYFKIEVLASTNMSSSRTVPIFIKEIGKEKDAPAPAPASTGVSSKDDDSIQPGHITDREHIMILNEDSVMENNAIDQFFIIKKLQFKNATPNNGNLTFQNYYHLRIKLSAVVADLYYDDYVGDDSKKSGSGETGSNPDNNELTLCELISEPIIVRGRNPNFYSERKDILIKGRSSNSKISFKNAKESSLPDQGVENDKEDAEYNETVAEPAAQEPAEVEAAPVVVPPPITKIEPASEAREVEEDSSTSEEPDSSARDSCPPAEFPAANKVSIDLNSGKRYKYFPISSVYYLPPINVVYFPHGAHQSSNQREESRVEAVVHDGRKSSNVYFK